MYALFFINLYGSLTFVGIFSDESELKLGVKKLWSWYHDGSDGEKLNEFCMKYNITEGPDTSIFQAQQSKIPELVALAKIIDKYEDENTTPLYQMIINLLNSKP